MENTNLTLEEHRNKTVEEIMYLLNNHDRVACVRYTGYGKTYYIMKEITHILKNKNFLILVPTRDLLNSYKSIFEDNVIIKTYQSLLHKDAEYFMKYENIDFILCDECHRIGDKEWCKYLSLLIESIENVKVIGFTATPVRGDAVNVVSTFFNNVQIDEFDLLDSINAGYTSKIKYIIGCCKITQPMQDIVDKSNEIDRYEIKNLLNIPDILKKHIDNDVLQDNLKIVVFVTRINKIDEASCKCKEWFHEAFPDKRINIYNVHSQNTSKTNKTNQYNFSNNSNKNDIDIMISVDKFTHGIHVPNCSIVMLLRKTISPVTYIQQIGRAINKNKPIIFDLVDNENHLYYNRHSDKGHDRAGRPDKIMFDNCIEIVDETVGLEDILERLRGRSLPFKPYRDYDENVELKIKSMIDDNKNIKDMMKETGLTRFAIQYYFDKLGYNKLLPRLSDEDKEYIRNNYNSELGYASLVEIAKQINHSESSTVDYAISIGLYKKSKRNLITDEEIAHACDLYKQYKNVQKVSDEIGRNVRVVRNMIKSGGLELLNSPKRIDGALINTICNQYANKVPIKKICSDLHIDIRTVRHILKEKGIYRNKEYTKYEDLTESDKDYICYLYTVEKIPIRKLKTKLHKDDKTIKRVLDERNIPIIKRKEVSDDERMKIYMEYKKGKTSTQISKEFNRGARHIRRILEGMKKKYE